MSSADRASDQDTYYSSKKDHSRDRIGVVTSSWIPEITGTLTSGVKNYLISEGVKAENIFLFDVPGSFELPASAQFLLESTKLSPLDAVICIGCVIQGETKHFDFISQTVSDGIKDVGLKYNVPVIFGVLTPDTLEQAQDRAGGKYGNKGEEAAAAAIQMIDLKRSL